MSSPRRVDRRLWIARPRTCYTPMDKHQNEDGEILVNCVRDDFKYALWMNHVKNPRFKAIEVPEFDGLLLELPKELSMATIAMRAFHRTCCEFESLRTRDRVPPRRKHVMSRILARRTSRLKWTRL